MTAIKTAGTGQARPSGSGRAAAALSWKDELALLYPPGAASTQRPNDAVPDAALSWKDELALLQSVMAAGAHAPEV